MSSPTPGRALAAPGDRLFELVHGADGFQSSPRRGSVETAALHLEVSRRGELRPSCDGQGWIG